MDSKKLTELILEDSFFLAEAIRRLQLMKGDVENKLFSGQEKEGATPPNQEDQEWLKSVTEKVEGQFQAKTVNKIFDEAEKEIKKIPVLSVFVPLLLPDSEINKLGDYIKKNFKTSVLLEIKIDPSLIAGPALAWNGVYKDYSVRKKVKENREEIIRTLSEFIKR